MDDASRHERLVIVEGVARKIRHRSNVDWEYSAGSRSDVSHRLFGSADAALDRRNTNLCLSVRAVPAKAGCCVVGRKVLLAKALLGVVAVWLSGCSAVILSLDETERDLVPPGTTL